MKQRTIRKPDMPLQGLPPAPSSAQGEPEREQSPAAAPQDTGARQQPADNNQNQHATLTLVGKQQVIKIPVTKLRVSPFNARKIRPPKRITKIAESMKVEGQVDPLYVYPGIGEDEGYFMVLGGETRRLAALQISKPELDALVDTNVDPNDGLALTKLSSILNDSADETPLDKGMCAIELVGKGYTQVQIADALDLDSHTTVQRLIKLASLPKRFIDLGQEYPDKFSGSLGDLINRALEKHGDEFAFSLLESTLLRDMTHKKIEAAIKEGPVDKTGGEERGKRLRRDGGFDIPTPGAPGGRYDVYKSKTPGLKVLKMQIEVPDDLAKDLHDDISELLQRFIETAKSQQ